MIAHSGRSRANSAPTFLLFYAALASSIAYAQSETIIHNFIPPNGSRPDSGVIADQSGNLYGTTNYGGPFGSGVIFKLDAGGHYSVLHAFSGVDGAGPTGLARDPSGDFFGTAYTGGSNGEGVVFKLQATGQFTVLYTFGGADGSNPGPIALGASGNLYGSTFSGGTFGLGVVFKLEPNGIETVLHSFTGGYDGAYAGGSLVLDDQENLYGTAFSGGGSNKGVVFKVDTSGQFSVFHSFSGPDGANPEAGLTMNAKADLFGTTGGGGAANQGVVFKLDPAGNETLLHNFQGMPDGTNPEGILTFDSQGNLYGTTFLGGTFNDGAAFRIDAVTHAESIAWSFNYTDGETPAGRLVIVNGNLFGTTLNGGPANNGVLFKITLAPVASR